MKFLLLLFLFPFTLLGQKNQSLPKDLAGVWTGYMYNDTTQQTNNFELAISENGKKLSGYTYTIFLIDGKKNIGIKSVKIKTRKELLLIEDEKLIDNNYDAPPAKGVRTFMELHYTENDTVEIFRGSWKTNITREYNSVTGNVFLERKKQPEETAIIPKLRQLNLLGQLSFFTPTGTSSVKNTLAFKNSPEKTNLGVSQKTGGAENEKNVAAIVKNNKQAAETEKIIPDTTIINPEITIYMFPKNDRPARDTATPEEKIHVLTNMEHKVDIKKDSLVSLAGRKELEEPKNKIVKAETEKNGIAQKAARDVDLAKNSAALETGNKKSTEVFSEVSKKKEMVLSMAPFDSNLLEITSRNISEKSVAKNEIISRDNQRENVQSADLNKKKKTAVLNPVLAGKTAIIKDSLSSEQVTVKNKTTSDPVKIQRIDSIRSDNKNETVIIATPGDKKEIQEIVSQKILSSERTVADLSQLSLYPREKEVAAKSKTPQLITEEMLSAREITTIRIVEIERDTLIFSLFDNGVIDGDTVSVLLNGEVIMSKIGLLARAYNDTIYLTPEMGDSIHIILYAENLGSIPPNTGLLVVREGKMNHEIRFSGDLKKNSAIILKRKRHIIDGK